MRNGLVLACLVALLACKSRPVDPPAAGSAAAPEKPVAPAVSQADAEAFGKSFAAALAKCDPAALDALVDMDAMDKRSGLGGTTKFGAALCAGLGTDYSVHFSRVVMVDGAPRPRIRVRVGPGVNFMEPVLGKTNGTLRAIDVYNVRSGELMTETFRSLGQLQTDLPGARAYIDAQKLYTAKKYDEAKARYAQIPEKWRKTIKTIALLGVSIDFHSDDATYQATMTEFAKNFPDDIALQLVLIDQYAIAKQHAKLIASLEAMLTRLGDDAYVRTLLAEARLDAGDQPGALADAKAAFAAEPDMIDTRNALLDAAAAANDTEQALISLDASVKAGDDLKAIMADLKANKADAAFLASPPFKAWLKAHPAK